MTTRTWAVGAASLEAGREGDLFSLTLRGDLARRDQLEPLQAALVEITTTLLDGCTRGYLHVVGTEDCISFLLRPMLLLAETLGSRLTTIDFHAGDLDGYLIPWHETLHVSLVDSGAGRCAVIVHRHEL